MRAFVDDDELHIAVSDDGSGGAAPSPGSGLAGLADRLLALGGALHIESRSGRGRGTMVSAAMPLAAVPDLERERRRIRAQSAELYEQITDEDNLAYGKMMLLCAGGNAAITDRERNWMEGYLTSAGAADWILEALTTYDDADMLEELGQESGMVLISRAVLYDALRLYASDGPVNSSELDRVQKAADVLGIGHDVVAALYQIVVEKHALQHRRSELAMAPILAGAPPVPPS